MSILATTDTGVLHGGARPHLRVVHEPGPVTVAWFENLVTQHGQWLRNYVRRRMADPALVDDAVQETLLRVCRSSPPDDPQDLRRWLAGVARRTCADVWRARPPGAEELDPVDEALPALAVVPGSDEHLAAVVRRAGISDALWRLPPRHRRLLAKQVLLGLSYEEIADEEDVSVACVTSAIGRARAGFRRRYVADDARTAPVWLAVLYRATERWRSRAQALVGGHAVELAAASLTLGMAAVLVAAPVPAASSSVEVQATGTGDRPLQAEPTVIGGPAGAPNRPAVGSPAAGRPNGSSPPPATPPRRAVGQVAADEPDVTLTPERWRVSFRAEVGGPHDVVSARAETTIECGASRVGATVCPVATLVPGAE